MAVPRVTDARVENYLTGKGLSFFRDNDDDIVVGYEEIFFFFTIGEDLLRIAGWRRGKLKDDEGRAAAAANALNTAMVMPRTVISGDGNNIVFENVVDTATGLTDEQLGTFIDVAFEVSFRAADRIDEEFPGLVQPVEEGGN